jgi:tetratricopeptide (TPR) repeat protein
MAEEQLARRLRATAFAPVQLLLTLLLAGALSGDGASAQPEDFSALSRQVKQLYRAQRYGEAAPIAQRALAAAERQRGPHHTDVAFWLNVLALLYKGQGRYADAEPLYKRSLSIREKALGANHPDVAASLNNLAELHHAQGRYHEVEPY